MAVFERKYTRHTGTLTPQATRFLILPKYSFRDVFKSRMMVVFYVVCFIFPLFLGVMIYAANNAQVLKLFPNVGDFLEIGTGFFQTFLYVQGTLSFFLALFIGPGLVARDLANNGLPLYLSRPFSRTEYVVGKLTVMAALLSSITWVCGLILIAIQTNFAGFSWLQDNLRIVFAVFVGSWIWILTLSLLALSVSAWVRWRPLASFTMMFTLVGGLFFHAAVFGLFRSRLGQLVDLSQVVRVIWAGLLGTEVSRSIPIWAAWVSLSCFLAFFLFLLNRKLRAYEVIS